MIGDKSARVMLLDRSGTMLNGPSAPVLGELFDFLCQHSEFAPVLPSHRSPKKTPISKLRCFVHRSLILFIDYRALGAFVSKIAIIITALSWNMNLEVSDQEEMLSVSTPSVALRNSSVDGKCKFSTVVLCLKAA